jgi:GNAT superfamily N-acetyltransferase
MAPVPTALRTTGEDPLARELLAAVSAEYEPDYGPPAPGTPGTVEPAELTSYVALVEGGRPVAGGGLRPLGDGVGEVKRMYVVPDRRGRGLARRLLAEIEALARDAGYRLLRLDTAGGLSRFYLAAGYAPVDDYNGNRLATFWGEKAL